MEYKLRIGEYRNDDRTPWTLIMEFVDGTFLELEFDKDNEYIEYVTGNSEYEPTETELQEISEKWRQ